MERVRDGGRTGNVMAFGRDVLNVWGSRREE